MLAGYNLFFKAYISIQYLQMQWIRVFAGVLLPVKASISSSAFFYLLSSDQCSMAAHILCSARASISHLDIGD